jgi:beta-lactamase class A
VGAFALDTVTGRRVMWRPRERFPMCSVFKGVAAAAVLRGGEDLAKRVRYTEADVEGQYTPVTGTAGHLANGMTVGELCSAAVSYSDGAAGNLLLRELGGPTAITRFCRSLGDPVTRLDRWEPELNSAEPWRVEDTTSPAAIGQTYARLVLGSALDRQARRQLTRWLLDCTTNGGRFRAGLPQGWVPADKTGSGNYGTANDVGVVWRPDGSPIVLAVMTAKPAATAGTPSDNPLVARTTALLAAALS